MYSGFLSFIVSIIALCGCGADGSEEFQKFTQGEWGMEMVTASFVKSIHKGVD